MALLLLAGLLFCGCRKATQNSSSMDPTIKRGEKVALDFTAYTFAKPRRWDVVAFEPPMFTNQTWIMRVVAVPGEPVAFASGGITINGKPLFPPPHLFNATYVSVDRLAPRPAPGSVASPYVVPNGSYFVLGDNSTNSNDSRIWGAVPLTNIIARVRGK